MPLSFGSIPTIRPAQPKAHAKSSSNLWPTSLSQHVIGAALSSRLAKSWLSLTRPVDGRRSQGATIKRSPSSVKYRKELPLALDQAGAYICSKQTSFFVYQNKIKEGIKIAFGKGLLDPGLSTQKDSVLTTWELSFQELSDDAAALMHVICYGRYATENLLLKYFN
ncbi:hypothetical protein RUND412_007085 [Rhizina undulata]